MIPELKKLFLDAASWVENTGYSHKSEVLARDLREWAEKDFVESVPLDDAQERKIFQDIHRLNKKLYEVNLSFGDKVQLFEIIQILRDSIHFRDRLIVDLKQDTEAYLRGLEDGKKQAVKAALLRVPELFDAYNRVRTDSPARHGSQDLTLAKFAELVMEIINSAEVMWTAQASSH